jgi:hypothetical protein
MELNLYAAAVAGFLAFLMQPFGLQELSELREVTQLWSNLTNITERAENFNAHFDISKSLPTGEESWRDYRKVEVALLKWHNELYHIQDSVSCGKSADQDHAKLLVSALTLETQRLDKRYTNERSEKRKLYNERGKGRKHSEKKKKTTTKGSSERKRSRRKYKGRRRQKKMAKRKAGRPMESWEIDDDDDEEEEEGMDFHEGQNRDEDDDEEDGQPGEDENKRRNLEQTPPGNYAKLSPSTIGWISRVLTMYAFTVALSSASSDSKLIIFTLAMTLLLLPLVWRGKQMNDALSDAVVGLRLRQVQLAGVFPSSSKAEMIAQALILQKIEVITTYWEKQALGLSFKIPFIDMPISLENEILGGMLVANILKVIEVFFSKKDEKKKNPVRPKTRLEMNAVGMERD